MNPISLHDAVEEHLAKALQSPQGRSSHTLVGGRDRVLRQTMVALKAPRERHDLSAHEDSVVLLTVAKALGGT